MPKSKHIKLNAADYPLVPKNLLAMPQDYWDRVVYIDLHGTLVDWVGPFCLFAQAVLGRPLACQTSDLYFIGHDALSGISNAEFNQLFYQFVKRAPGGYGNLQPYPGVVAALQKLRDAGLNIRIATWTPGPFELSPANQTVYGSGAAQAETIALIKRLGFPVEEDDIIFVSGRDKATEMTCKLVRSPLLIEDSPSTAASAARDYGLACFLIEQPYNKGIYCPGVTSFKSFAQATPKILELFETLNAAGVLR
jgi:hypothetical protein